MRAGATARRDDRTIGGADGDGAPAARALPKDAVPRFLPSGWDIRRRPHDTWPSSVQNSYAPINSMHTLHNFHHS